MGIGIFSSLKDAHKTLYEWPKEYSYSIKEWEINKDYRARIESRVHAEKVWFYGVDYYVKDYKREKDIDLYILWPSKLGSTINFESKDLDPERDKELIAKYRKYSKDIGRFFLRCKFRDNKNFSKN